VRPASGRRDLGKIDRHLVRVKATKLPAEHLNREVIQVKTEARFGPEVLTNSAVYHAGFRTIL
jgi:hypothetical protein